MQKTRCIKREMGIVHRITGRVGELNSGLCSQELNPKSCHRTDSVRMPLSPPQPLWATDGPQCQHQLWPLGGPTNATATRVFLSDRGSAGRLGNHVSGIFHFCGRRKAAPTTRLMRWGIPWTQEGSSEAGQPKVIKAFMVSLK